MKRYNIYGILFLALLLRLYHIDFPVGGWQDWRQADTAAMARNFYENGFNLFYPQIDWGGNSSGFVESEFPIYPFVVSIVYRFFDVNDMWGRILSVLFSLSTIYGLYLLTKKYLSEKAALWAAFIYAIIPLNIYFGRAFMPESAMLMCSIWGIYWFALWLEGSRARDFILAAAFVSLAVLLKIPTLHLGLPLLFLAWLRFRSNTFKMKTLWLFALLILLPVAAWYYHAHQLFLQSGLSFGIWGFGTDKWGNFDIIITPKFYNRILFQSIAERHLTYAGFLLFVIGLFLKRKSNEEKLFDYWLLAVLIYFLIVAKGNQVHDYYQLPFILPAVAYIGKVFDKYVHTDSIRHAFRTKPLVFSFLALCLMGMFTLSYLRYDLFMNHYETYDTALFRLTSAVQRSTTKSDLVVAVSENNPIVLYRCDRKGWNSSPEELDSTSLSDKKNRGAKFLVGETSFFNTKNRQRILDAISSNYTLVENGTDYFVILLH